MEKIILVFLLLYAFLTNILSQKIEIPEGYLLQYSQDFQGVKLQGDFVTYFQNQQGKIVLEKNNKYFRINNLDSIDLKPTLYVLNNFIFGDFIFEFSARLKSFSKEKVPELGILMSFKDTLNYYSLNLIFKNNDSLIIRLIANDRGKTVLKYNSIVYIKLKEWNDFVVTRELISREIKIYINNRNIPVFTINDWSLVMGHLGFSIKNAILDIDNIKIWSQTYIENKL